MSASTGTDPAWKPHEDQATILSEDRWLQGAFIAAIAYGAISVLCIQCFFILVRSFRIKKSQMTRAVLILFDILLFCLNTGMIATTLQFTQQAFVDFRNYDGGPSTYEVDFFSIPVDAAGNDCLVVTTMVADALLLWRCTVIYKNSGVDSRVSLGLASAMWIAEFILGTLFLTTLTSTSVFGTVNFTLGFWCFSLALNVLATILIVSRLFFFRYRLKHVLGGQHASQYTSIIAMIVESELLYTTFLIMYIVPFVRNDSLVNVFVQAPSLVQSIAALMIVYRVAEGKGWTKETHAEVTNLGAGSRLQLSNVSSTLGITGSDNSTEKTFDSGVQIAQEMSLYAQSRYGSSATHV